MSAHDLRHLAAASVLALAIALPWVVAYAVVLCVCGRWTLRQWGAA